MRSGSVFVALTTLIVGLLVAAIPVAAEEGLKDCDEGTPAQEQELARAELQQVFEARREFADSVGLTPDESFNIMRAKRARHQLIERMRREAEALLVALDTDEADEQFSQEKVEAYLKLRDETLASLKQWEDWLIESLDARNRPKVLGALMVMSAIDNGIRSNCAVHSPVSGSASSTSAKRPALLDRQPRRQRQPRPFGPRPAQP